MVDAPTLSAQVLKKLNAQGLGQLGNYRLSPTLVKMGYTEEEAQAILEKYGPKLRVYGSNTSRGALEKGNVVTATIGGQTYTGTQEFIDQKKAEAAVTPPSAPTEGFTGVVQEFGVKDNAPTSEVVKTQVLMNDKVVGTVDIPQQVSKVAFTPEGIAYTPYEKTTPKVSDIINLENINLPPKSNIQLPYQIRGTQDISPEAPQYNIRTQPFIKKEQTGIFIAPDGTKVPQVKYTYVDPTVIGKAKERPATVGEIAQFRQQETALSLETGTASTEKVSALRPITNTIETAIQDVAKEYYSMNKYLKETTTDPFFDTLAKTGLTTEELARISALTNPATQVPYLINKDSQDFTVGFNQAILEDIRDQPLKQLALLAGGEALGAGFKGVSALLAKIPGLGGDIASYAFKIGASVYGGKELVDTVARDITLATTASQLGKNLGVTAKDAALLGIGFESGEKDITKLIGELRTKGATQLNVPQGEYPQEPIEKQLELFQKNIYPEISEKPVAFHTTPDIFYESGKITPKEGTSELAGLYASTQVSTPFSKISGSGGEFPKIFSDSEDKLFTKDFINLLKKAFGPEQYPGVAGLIPKEFRVADYRYSDVPLFEGQKYVKGKGYAYFIDPAELGIMDIPLMKSEIESIARPEAGDYLSTGQKFYTKIKGVKVPIDIFEYADSAIDKDILQVAGETKISKGEKLSPESYSTSGLSSSVLNLPSAFSFYDDFKNMMDQINSDYSSLEGSTISKVTSINKTAQIKSSTSKSSSSNRVSSGISSSIDISSEISQLSSDISNSINSEISEISDTRSAKSTKTSGKSSRASTTSIIPKEELPPILKLELESKEKKNKKKEPGYDVYGKVIRTNTFAKINTTPVSRGRAFDIGAYYVDNTLARQFKVKRSTRSAEEDYQFTYIPVGYYESVSKKIRSFKIKKGRRYAFEEQFIEKNIGIADTVLEKEQLKYYKSLNKQIKGI